MKIFIGSSLKNKNRARHVAKALEDVGFEVFRWWDRRVFQGGDITIERLIEMSEVCDGAVFIFGADDKTITRRRTGVVEMASPRDNVVLEYGIFVSKNGVKRTLFVTEENVKIPTDLQGVTYLGRRGYAKRITERFKDVFRSFHGNENTGLVTAHINKKLIDLIYQGGQPQWSSRSLYLDKKGAKAWEAVEQDPRYSGGREFAAVHRLIRDMVIRHNLNKYDCIVSFGPGLGNLDKEVVPHLRGNQMVRYIPVDINHYLANYASDNVYSSSKQIHVPFCIIGDFEDGMSLIAETIHSFTAPGRAFIMLGGTFGNLELGENTFLIGLYDCLEEDDIAILDVFTYTDDYELQNDPLLPLANQPDAVKRFLAYGVERITGVDVETIMQNISDHIIENPIPTEEASPIPNTKAFEFISMESNRTLIYVRRYKINDFVNHLESLNFEIISAESISRSYRGILRSVIMIRKR